MPLETSPIGPPRQVPGDSDIAAVQYDAGGLVVLIARELLEDGRVAGLQVTFQKVFAFRFLDEADLATYWAAKGFVRGHHVLSVISGGWCSEENERQGFVTKRKEWLVVTGNGCLSVFAAEAPAVEELEFDGAM